jgi:hypothetical protein
MILKRSGKAAEAQALLNQAADLDVEFAIQANIAPKKDLGGEANDLDRIHIQSNKSDRPWEGRLSIGVQYDDELALPTGGGTTPVDRKGSAGIISLLGHYRWLDTEKSVGRAQYRLYQSVYTKRGDWNTQDRLLSVNAGRRTNFGEFSLQYDLQSTGLGGDPYLLGQKVGPRWVRPYQGNQLTEMLYQFGVQKFYNDRFVNNSDRNARTHSMGGNHYYFLPQRWDLRGNIYGGFSYAKEIAGGSPTEDDWSHDGSSLSVGVAVPVWKKTIIGADLQYLSRRFPHDNIQQPGVKRSDHEWNTVLILSRSFENELDLSFQFLNQRNRSSIAVFDQNRRVYGLTTAWRY